MKKASAEFDGTGKGITVEASDLKLNGKVANLTCEEAVWKATAAKTKENEVITYSGCKLGSTACASGDNSGQIVTSQLEAYDLEDEGHDFAYIAGQPIMTIHVRKPRRDVRTRREPLERYKR